VSLAIYKSIDKDVASYISKMVAFRFPLTIKFFFLAIGFGFILSIADTSEPLKTKYAMSH
jgi:hypothetical protein